MKRSHNLPTLFAFALLTLVGCEDEGFNGKKVDHGPPVAEGTVVDALRGLFKGSDPSVTKVGAFTHFESTAKVAGGALKILMADTGQTVIRREEDANEIRYFVHEKKFTYKQTGAPEKTASNFELKFKKKSLTDPDSETTTMAEGAPLSAEQLRTSVHDFLVHSSETAAANPWTYHHLRAWEDEAPPPGKVVATPDCIGIPRCRLSYRHVSFDIVTWEIPEGNLWHFELITSPQVPQLMGISMNFMFNYIPGLMSSCISRLINIGESSKMKTLVTQCNNVINFTFDATNSPPISDENFMSH